MRLHTELCRHCGQHITWSHGFWRDDTEDPGDGFGGDASCPARPILDTRAQPHEPKVHS